MCRLLWTLWVNILLEFDIFTELTQSHIKELKVINLHSNVSFWGETSEHSTQNKARSLICSTVSLLACLRIPCMTCINTIQCKLLEVRSIGLTVSDKMLRNLNLNNKWVTQPVQCHPVLILLLRCIQQEAGYVKTLCLLTLRWGKRWVIRSRKRGNLNAGFVTVVTYAVNQTCSQAGLLQETQGFYPSPPTRGSG